MYRTIKNGGFEQAVLKMVDEEGLLSEDDKKRLAYLESLPQNRSEKVINGKETIIKNPPA